LCLPDVTDSPHLACPTEEVHRQEVDAKCTISSFSPAANSVYFFLTNSTPFFKINFITSHPKTSRNAIYSIKNANNKDSEMGSK
jgi:hypothetical protein